MAVLAASLLLLLLLSGCESIGYYAHVSGGQLKLLAEREPVQRVLARLAADDDAETRQLAERLRLSQEVLDYAEGVLGLEVGGRYRSYVALDRDSVVWNVFAAPELSLTPYTWCYPFAGCVPYRGYFDRQKAEMQSEKLAERGLETFVGGVAAYSTLGWFDDPLLSTFMDMREGDFVELLLHELAHSRVWIKGDATFNESFASFVGRQGARDWYAAQERQAAFDAHLAEEMAWDRAIELLQATRDELGQTYDGDAPAVEKATRKAEVLDAAAACLAKLAESTGMEGYRRLIPRLNNAYLASLATYSDGVPAFAALFAEVGEDWAVFFDQVEALAERTEDDRSNRLMAPPAAGPAASPAAGSGSGEDEVATRRDDEGTEQVQCETFSGHGLDGEVTGAEHDDVRSGGDG